MAVAADARRAFLRGVFLDAPLAALLFGSSIVVLS
jgi:hypothetical protein